MRWDGATSTAYAPLSFLRLLIIVAGRSPYEEPLLVVRIDDPKFFDCRFQRRCLVGCFDYTYERAARSLDGAVNFPLGRLLGHGRAVAVDLFKHAPYRAARRLAAGALLARIWDFWFRVW
jgi:hypothetical protein